MLPALVQRALQALAVLAPQVQELQVLQVQQELAAQALRAPLALKERRGQVLTALAELLGQPAPQVLQAQV